MDDPIESRARRLLAEAIKPGPGRDAILAGANYSVASGTAIRAIASALRDSTTHS